MNIRGIEYIGQKYFDCDLLTITKVDELSDHSTLARR